MLYFQNMDTNLVPPIMMHLAGIDVDECPKFLSNKSMESNHYVYLPISDIRLIFQLEGTIPYLPSQRPMKV